MLVLSDDCEVTLAASGADLVLAGADGRRGVALDADHPTAFELDAPAGARFQMSYRIGPDAG